jgi:hypothetical protein
MSLSAVAAEEQAIQEDMEGVQEHDDAMQQDQPAGSDADNAMVSAVVITTLSHHGASKRSSRTQLCNRMLLCIPVYSVTRFVAYTRPAPSCLSGCAQGEAETAGGRRW